MSPRTSGDRLELRADQQGADVQYGSFRLPAAGSSVDVRLGYRRSLDFDATNSPGQDAAAVCSDARHIVAVVVDGVGQSFFGNLAAEFLCGWLLEALWTARANPPTPEVFERSVRGQEGKVAAMVEGKSLDHLPDILRSALENTRKQGSQAVFTAIMWDLRRGIGHLYQVGDAVALIHRRSGECETVQAERGGRWSSAGRSQLHLRHSMFEDVEGFVIKTDGASADWGTTPGADAFGEEAFTMMASERAALDDVCAVAAFVTPGIAPQPSVRPRPRPDAATVQPASDPVLDGVPSSSTTAANQEPRPEPIPEPKPVPMPTPPASLAVFAMGFAAGVLFTCAMGVTSWWMVGRLDPGIIGWGRTMVSRIINRSGTDARPEVKPVAPPPAAKRPPPADRAADAVPEPPPAASLKAELPKAAAVIPPDRIRIESSHQSRDRMQRDPSLPGHIKRQLSDQASTLIEVVVQGVPVSRVTLKPRKEALPEAVTLTIAGDGRSFHVIPGFVAEKATDIAIELFDGERRIKAGEIRRLRRGDVAELSVTRVP